MPEYDILYAALLETVMNAIEELEQMNYGRAKKLLVEAREKGIKACGLSENYKVFQTPTLR